MIDIFVSILFGDTLVVQKLLLIEYYKQQIIEIDLPYYLRRKGNRLGPNGCYIEGISLCFIAAFVSVIPSEGIKPKLNVNA